MNKIDFQGAGEKKKMATLTNTKEINLAFAESQQLFRRMIEGSRTGVFMADVRGNIFYVNHALAQMIGYNSKNDIIGMNLADVLFVDTAKRNAYLERLNELGSVQDFELDLKSAQGGKVILSVKSKTTVSDKGDVIGVEGFVNDVTKKAQSADVLLDEKRKLEQLLEFNEVVSSIKEFGELVENVVERAARILEAQKCSLMLLDEKMKLLTVKGAKGASGAVVNNAKIKLGEPIAGVVAGEGRPLLVRNIEYDRKFQRANRPAYFGRSFMIVPIKLGHKVFGVINVADKILKPGQSKGSKLNYEEAFNEIDLRILCAIAREVSVALDNVKLFEELNALAVTDPLVHIYNYRQFSSSLDYEIKRYRRVKSPLCLVMIDVDHFKMYNDAFGHQEGNVLLQALGKIFEEQLREMDIVCRYAGDEFAIILPNTDLKGARLAVEKVVETVRTTTFKKEVTLSIGLAAFAEDLTQYQLIANADQALYKAKREGKNRICEYEEPSAAA